MRRLSQRTAADVQNPSAATESKLNPNFDRLVDRLQGEGKNERDLRRIGTALGLTWQGMKTTKRAVEIRLRQLNSPACDAFVPAIGDMRLSAAARRNKMFTSQQVPSHPDYFVMLQYSMSQLCVELKKAESRASSSSGN